MKKYIFIILIMITAMYSCSSDDHAVVSKPTITSIDFVGNTTQVTVPSTLGFNVSVRDELRPLSTLEVEVLINDIVVSSKSFRTKGNQASIENESIDIPFAREMNEGEAILVRFTSINVDGDEAIEDRILTSKRPILPSTLYYIIPGAETILLNNSVEEPYIYKSIERIYESKISGKIATKEDIKEAEFIWGKGRFDSESAITTEGGEDIEFDYAGWIVKQIMFDAYTFLLDVEGDVATKVTLKAREDEDDENMQSTIISLKTGEFLEIAGIDMSINFNPDFFNHSASSKVYEFLGADGDWEIIYSPKYKALWVTRMQDVAPETYWVVGHALSTATAWHDDFGFGGWDLDNFKQVAYMRKLAENKYQATVYLSNAHEWDSFEIQFYSNRTWDATPAEFTPDRVLGDNAGFAVGGTTSITSGEGFVPGYFKLILDMTNGVDKATLNIERLK